MPRLHHLARRIRTTTAAGLVPLLLLTSVPACATRAHRSASPAVSAEAQPVARPLSEWSRVEAVPVGTLIDVQLYGDAAPPDRQKVTGRLHAVTADTLTVVLYEGQRIVRPLPRSDVHIVQTRRPIERRWKGWLTFLSVPVGFLGFITILTGGDFVFGKVLELGVKFGALASLPGFLLHRWQRIYEVPPRGRTAHQPGGCPGHGW